MPLTREKSEDAYGFVSQDPRPTVNATLRESKFPTMQAYILRPQRLLRSALDKAIKSSSRQPSSGAVVRNDLTQGNGTDTYGTLDTSRTAGIWDRLRNASSKATEPP